MNDAINDRDGEALVVTNTTAGGKRISQALSAAGVNCKVYVAPRGSDVPRLGGALGQLPRSQPTDWINLLRAELRPGRRLLIAAEASVFGDAWAWSISEKLLPERPRRFLAMRLRGLDASSVLTAYLHAEPLDEVDSHPGVSRQLIDDAVLQEGWVPDIPSASARVLLGVLVAAYRARPGKRVASFVVPSGDLGDEFVAECEVHDTNEYKVKVALQECAGFVREGGHFKAAAGRKNLRILPWRYGDAVISLARLSGADIFEIDQALWRLYLQGSISYPGGSTAALTTQSVAELADLAARHNVKFDVRLVPALPNVSRHDFETARPLTVDVDIQRPMGLVSVEDFVLGAIARHLLCCGLPFAAYTPEIPASANWAEGLSFSSTRCLRHRPWPRPSARSAIATPDKMLSIVKDLMDYGVGLPTEWIPTIRCAVRTGLIDLDGRLSQAGEVAHSAIPAKWASLAELGDLERELCTPMSPSRSILDSRHERGALIARLRGV